MPGALAIILFVATPLFAGQNRWTSTGPFLVNFGNFEVAPSDGNVVVAPTNNGIMRSRNAGKSWKYVQYPDGYPKIIKIHPSRPDVFIAVDSNVYSTQDSGQTWEQLADTPFQNQQAADVDFDPLDPSILYSVTQGYEYDWVEPSRIFRSNDAGKTWSVLLQVSGFDQPDLALEVDPTDPRRLYFLIANRLYRSLNRGKSWKWMRALQDFANDLKIDPDSGKVYVRTARGILRSENQGKTWRLLPAPNCGSLSIDPLDPKNFYLFGGTCLYKSVDSGKTWNALSFPFSSDPPYPYHSPLVPNTTKPGLLLFTTQNLYRSEDGGATWRVDTQGHGNQSATFRINSLGDILAGGFRQFFIRRHGSPKWSFLDVPANFDVWDYEFHPADPSLIVMGGRLRGAKQKSILISKNVGRSWEFMSAPFSPVYDVLTDSFDSKRIYALGCVGRRSHIAWTTDAGKTWNSAKTGFGCGYENFIQDPLHPSTLFVSTVDGLITSHDKGKSWGLVGGFGPNEIIASLDVLGSTVYGAVYNAARDSYSVRHSTDGGKTWQESSNPVDGGYFFFIRAHPSDPNTVFSGGFTKFFVSTDGGATWTQFSTEGIQGNDKTAYSFVVSPAKPNQFWISTSSGIYSFDTAN